MNVITMLANELGVDVNIRGKNGITAMHAAAASGYAPAVTLLATKYGVDVNVQNTNGLTPWKAAMLTNHAHICLLITKLGRCAQNRSHCMAKATLKCTGCRSVSYCSKEHQRADWPSHGPDCKSISKYRNSLAAQVAVEPTKKKNKSKKGKRK